jgi:hypothetical protein
MISRNIRLTLGLLLAAVPLLLAGCSSNSTSAGITSGPQNGTVAMMVSDASTQDWATIGVKILSIALVPQGGGSNVTVYTAPTPAPMINLVQLDQLAEVLENATVPAGTYSGAVITISGNPGDIQLTTSADPSAGLLALSGASTTIPTGQVQVQGTSGSSGSLTANVNITFASPLVVSANGSNALDIEFDLSHPAFLVGHMGAGGPVWGINFRGPLHHHPIPDLTKFLLRDIYGTVTQVNSDGSLTITRDFPMEPAAATPASEGVISTNHTLTIFPDSSNGTIFYDVDAKTHQTVTTYATVASALAAGKFVRVTARFQNSGTLTAVRTWSATTFGAIYVSPEGHVLHVNTNTNVIDVENEDGLPVHLSVDANTLFFSGATQIGQGTSFLTNIERGFKVHASVVDPLAVPLVASTVDIEIARYDGVISAANLNGFTYTRNFPTVRDSYVVTLPYIAPGTANGKDPMTGNAITGFKWWNFTFPTIVDSDAAGGTDSTAISDFVNATGGTTVSFGGTALPITASGETYAKWGDTAAPNGWAAPWTVLIPTPIQLATTAQGFISGSPNGTITITVPLGNKAVTVNMSTVAGSATLVYQISRTGTTVTVTPEDISTSAGQTAVTTALISGTPVEVDGLPQPDGSIKAYVVLYYTGVKPTAID